MGKIEIMFYLFSYIDGLRHALKEILFIFSMSHNYENHIFTIFASILTIHSLPLFFVFLKKGISIFLSLLLKKYVQIALKGRIAEMLSQFYYFYFMFALFVICAI